MVEAELWRGLSRGKLVERSLRVRNRGEICGVVEGLRKEDR